MHWSIILTGSVNWPASLLHDRRRKPKESELVRFLPVSYAPKAFEYLKIIECRTKKHIYGLGTNSARSSSLHRPTA